VIYSRNIYFIRANRKDESAAQSVGGEATRGVPAE